MKVASVVASRVRPISSSRWMMAGVLAPEQGVPLLAQRRQGLLMGFRLGAQRVDLPLERRQVFLDRTLDLGEGVFLEPQLLSKAAHLGIVPFQAGDQHGGFILAAADLHHSPGIL